MYFKNRTNLAFIKINERNQRVLKTIKSSNPNEKFTLHRV
jgi:hypothetical protein